MYSTNGNLLHFVESEYVMNIVMRFLPFFKYKEIMYVFNQV